jgi:hypothetical protein
MALPERLLKKEEENYRHGADGMPSVFFSRFPNNWPGG